MVSHEKMLRLAIIPARGGSKRIPRKNIRSFCGKPILAYSIEAARYSQLFDEVMVSTNDAEVAMIAAQYGASVPFLRSEVASSDYATTADVLIEVIEKYQELGKEYTHICCIYPTAPFVTGKKLNTAFRLLNEKKADSVVPVVPFSYPPLRGLIVQSGALKMKWPENETVRSQDLEVLYHDCGQFYFTCTKALLQERTLFCQNTIPMYLSEMEAQDIDNEMDWELAEQKYIFLAKRGLI